MKDKGKLSMVEAALDRVAQAIGEKLTLKANGHGYYITLNDNPIALTSGRTLCELSAYIDGLRDMYLLTKYQRPLP